MDPANAGADPSNPQSWNGYAYVLNNPLALVDPFGLSSEDAAACAADLDCQLDLTINVLVTKGTPEEVLTALLDDANKDFAGVNVSLNFNVISVDAEGKKGDALFSEFGVPGELNVLITGSDTPGTSFGGGNIAIGLPAANVGSFGEALASMVPVLNSFVVPNTLSEEIQQQIFGFNKTFPELDYTSRVILEGGGNFATDMLVTRPTLGFQRLGIGRFPFSIATPAGPLNPTRTGAVSFGAQRK